MKKIIKMILPIATVATATMFPIVLTTGCTSSVDTEIVEGKTPSTPTKEEEPKETDPVVTPTVNSIEIAHNPNKVEYTEGDKLNLDGLKVKVIMSDKTEEIITSGFETSPADGTVLNINNTKVTVNYNGKTVSFDIKVKAKETEKEPVTPAVTLTGIEIENKPSKVEYTEGDKLNLDGLKVNKIMSDSTKVELKKGEYTTDPVDGTVLNNVGNQKITISYENKTVDFNVIINQKEEPKDIEELTNETVDEYIKNRTLSLFGVVNNGEDDIHWTCGTGWILADATPSNANDYVYYVATNKHVLDQWIQYSDNYNSDVYFMWGNADTAGKYEAYLGNKGDGYGINPSWTLTKYSFTNAGGYNKININNVKNIINNFGDIDMCVFKYDFGYDFPLIKYKSENVWDHAYSYDYNIGKNIFANAYATFDKLNQIQAQKGKINDFVALDDLSAEKMYVGGFPAYNGFTYYKQQEINPYDIEVYANANHNINDNLIDKATQLVIEKDGIAADWMGGGSSGSMLINEHKQICGIYWGGFNKDENNFWPSFSVFEIDEINKYLNQNILII